MTDSIIKIANCSGYYGDKLYVLRTKTANKALYHISFFSGNSVYRAPWIHK